MAERRPIVLSLDSRTHEPLPAADTLLPPVIDAAPGNIITGSSSGLYATVKTAATTSATIAGNGTTAAPLAATVVIDPVTTNIMSVTATGVKSVISKVPTASITLSGNGTPASSLTADVRVSPNVGNQLSQDTVGMLVPTRTVDTTTGSAYQSSNSTQTVRPVFNPKTTSESMIQFFLGYSNTMIIDLTALPSAALFSPLWCIRITISANGYTGNTLKFSTSASVPTITDPNGQDRPTSTYSIPFPSGDDYAVYEIYPFDTRRNYPYILQVGGFTRGKLQNIVKFTANGTYTPSSGVRQVRVKVWGGGAGGQGMAALDVSTASGSAGAYAESLLNIVSVASIPVTVGSGGSSVAPGSSAYGGVGGTSQFGTYITCTGGKSDATGITGGVATGGNIFNIPGQTGQGGIALSVIGNILNGIGGAAPFSSGNALPHSSIRGDAGGYPGGGGASGCYTVIDGSKGSGAGAAGAVIIEEYS